MFQKGEFIIYASRGVCEIIDISTINISGMNREKLYYFLRPVNDRDAKIFIPVESDKNRMRSILTEEEAQALIDSIPQIGCLWIADEKQGIQLQTGRQRLRLQGMGRHSENALETEPGAAGQGEKRNRDGQKVFPYRGG